MGVQLFTDNATTTLAAPLSSSATSMTVASSTLFPALSGSNWFIGTLQHLVLGVVTAWEIVQVTAVSGTTMTIVRAQEGTSALTWAAGDTFSLLLTSGGLGQFVQSGSILGAYKPANTGRASTTTFTNDPDLVVTVPAAGIYDLRSFIAFSAANSVNGGMNAQFTFTGSIALGTVASSGYTADGVFGRGATGYSGGYYVYEGSADYAFIDWVEMRGLVEFSTGGVFSLQWAQQSSSAITTTLYSGSFLKLRPFNS